jgi:hypothetical protein
MRPEGAPEWLVADTRKTKRRVRLGGMSYPLGQDNSVGRHFQGDFGSALPRAKALGYSVMPLRGICRVADTPIRLFVHSPLNPKRRHVP